MNTIYTLNQMLKKLDKWEAQTLDQLHKIGELRRQLKIELKRQGG